MGLLEEGTYLWRVMTRIRQLRGGEERASAGATFLGAVGGEEDLTPTMRPIMTGSKSSIISMKKFMMVMVRGDIMVTQGTQGQGQDREEGERGGQDRTTQAGPRLGLRGKAERKRGGLKRRKKRRGRRAKGSQRAEVVRVLGLIGKKVLNENPKIRMKRGIMINREWIGG